MNVYSPLASTFALLILTHYNLPCGNLQHFTAVVITHLDHSFFLFFLFCFMWEILSSLDKEKHC